MTATTTNTAATHFIVQTASCPQRSRKYGRYGRVAVLEVPVGVTRATMISERAKDVVSVVELWDECSTGKTARCAFGRAKAAAEALAAKLNAAS